MNYAYGYIKLFLRLLVLSYYTIFLKLMLDMAYIIRDIYQNHKRSPYY